MPQDKVIKVTDKRTIDPITGKVLTDKYRKHAEIPYDYVQMVIEEARKNKVNPYTALAIGLQETGFKKDSLNNPFMLGNYNPYGNIIEESVRFMSEKEKYAKKLGKVTDEDIIQAFNGYGTVKNSGKVYGIDTNVAPIDMNSNPVYGKRVVNLRDSVIMQNPEIRNLVEGKTPIKYQDGGLKFLKTVKPLRNSKNQPEELPEVVIEGEKKEDSLATKIAKESKDMGLLRLMTTGPLEMLAGIPQLVAGKVLTGKYQRPSEAYNLKGLKGIAADLALDPLNLGAVTGLATKFGKVNKALRGLGKGELTKAEFDAMSAEELYKLVGRDKNGELIGKGVVDADKASAMSRDHMSLFNDPEDYYDSARELRDLVKKGSAPNDWSYADRFMKARARTLNESPFRNPRSASNQKSGYGYLQDRYQNPDPKRDIGLTDDQLANREALEDFLNPPKSTHQQYGYRHEGDYKAAEQEWENVYEDIVRENLGDEVSIKRLEEERLRFHNNRSRDIAYGEHPSVADELEPPPSVIKIPDAKPSEEVYETGRRLGLNDNDIRGLYRDLNASIRNSLGDNPSRIENTSSLPPAPVERFNLAEAGGRDELTGHSIGQMVDYMTERIRNTGYSGTFAEFRENFPNAKRVDYDMAIQRSQGRVTGNNAHVNFINERSRNTGTTGTFDEFRRNFPDATIDDWNAAINRSRMDVNEANTQYRRSGRGDIPDNGDEDIAAAERSFWGRDWDRASNPIINEVRPTSPIPDYNIFRSNQINLAEKNIPESELRQMYREKYGIDPPIAGERTMDFNEFRNRHGVNAGPTSGDIDIANYNEYRRTGQLPSRSGRFQPRVRNASGFTKEEALTKVKDKEKIAKYTDDRFQNTVIKPNGEIVDVEPTESLGLHYVDNRYLHPDATPLSRQEYVDEFNKNIDHLNEIIAKNNKSGVPYKVEGLTSDGSLRFSSDVGGGRSDFYVRINPGKFVGEVKDVTNVEYYRSIPGLEMSNTSNGVFGDFNPRTGSAAYKSLNEYLKAHDLGRVKPGFNSQTSYSRSAWEKFIQKEAGEEGSAIGHYGNKQTVYGVMRNVASPAAVGTAVATQSKKSEGGLVMEKLKCGGKKGKMRKMATGGINKVPTMQSSQLATKFAQMNNLPQKALSENGLVKSGITGGATTGAGANGSAIMAGADLLSDTITGSLEARKKDYTDNRENPESTMRQNANLDVAGDVAKSTLSGAATGTAIAPGIGTIIGGAVGLVGSGVKNILGAKKRRQARQEAKEDWSNTWLNSSVQGLSTQSYKKGGKVEKVMHEFKNKQLHSGSKKGPIVTNRKQAIAIAMSEAGKSKAEGGPVLTTKMPISMAQGGKITGAGGPKEDKITKKIEDGSFIVPAENGDKAVELGRQYLGWENGEHANRNYPGTEVKVSDGEVLFTPEEVGVLSYNGINLDSLAPNAKTKLNEGEGYAPGLNPDKKQWMSDWQSKYEGSEDEASAAYDAQFTQPSTKQLEEPSTFDKVANYLPEVAGAVQIGAAIAGSRKAGQMPDVNVSQYLKDLATEQRKQAEYGFEPGAKSAMLSAIERDKRNANNAIVNRGGTAGEVMSNLQSTLSTGIDKSLNIEMADAEEKAKKRAIYANTTVALGGQDFDSKKIALENWMQWQDVNAGLLNAGIANIVGVRKLRAELDAMKKIGNNRVDVKSMIPKG